MIFHEIDNGIPLDEGRLAYKFSRWLLLVDNFTLLMDVVEWRSRFMMREYMEAKRCSAKDCHFNSVHQEAIAMFIQLEHLKGNTDLSLVDEVLLITDKFVTPMIQFFNDHGAFYINENGGIRPPRLILNEKITNTHESDKLEFPDVEPVRLIKWPGGKHYYAKKGSVDISVDGIAKWNSKKIAESMLKDAGYDIQ